MNLKPTLQWILERPARAFQVYFGGSRKAAIYEKCIDCVGTAQEAKKCVSTDCPLWMFRPGATKGEVPSCIPPREEIERLREANVSDAVREHAKRMGDARAADMDDDDGSDDD